MITHVYKVLSLSIFWLTGTVGFVNTNHGLCEVCSLVWKVLIVMIATVLASTIAIMVDPCVKTLREYRKSTSTVEPRYKEVGYNKTLL